MSKVITLQGLSRFLYNCKSVFASKQNKSLLVYGDNDAGTVIAFPASSDGFLARITVVNEGGAYGADNAYMPTIIVLNGSKEALITGHKSCLRGIWFGDATDGLVSGYKAYLIKTVYVDTPLRIEILEGDAFVSTLDSWDVTNRKFVKFGPKKKTNDGSKVVVGKCIPILARPGMKYYFPGGIFGINRRKSVISNPDNPGEIFFVGGFAIGENGTPILISSYHLDGQGCRISNEHSERRLLAPWRDPWIQSSGVGGDLTGNSAEPNLLIEILPESAQVDNRTTFDVCHYVLGDGEHHFKIKISFDMHLTCKSYHPDLEVIDGHVVCTKSAERVSISIEDHITADKMAGDGPLDNYWNLSDKAGVNRMNSMIGKAKAGGYIFYPLKNSRGRKRAGGQHQSAKRIRKLRRGFVYWPAPQLLNEMCRPSVRFKAIVIPFVRGRKSKYSKMIFVEKRETGTFLRECRK